MAAVVKYVPGSLRPQRMSALEAASRKKLVSLKSVALDKRRRCAASVEDNGPSSAQSTGAWSLQASEQSSHTHTRPSHASIEWWSRIPGVSNYAGRVVSSPSGAVVVVAA